MRRASIFEGGGATTSMSFMLPIRYPLAETTFRRLDVPELLADVASGTVYVDEVRAVDEREKKAAA